MMLADHLIAQTGSIIDLGGMVGGIASQIKRAQRFVMGLDATTACLELLRGRPSNLIKGLPLCRLPYPTMWVEMNGGFADNIGRDLDIAPIPAIQGTLIEQRGEQSGVMTIAWVHRPNDRNPEYHCNASPFGMWFDFSGEGKAVDLVREHHQKILANNDTGINDLLKEWLDKLEITSNIPPDAAAIRTFMLGRTWWARWADDPREVEAVRQHSIHMAVGLSPHGLGAVLMSIEAALVSGQHKLFQSLMNNWKSDIEGEGPFTQFFLTLLNSKNCTTRVPVSMSKLNKARAKRSGNKPPLLDYTAINLTVSPKRLRAGEASGLSHDTMRQHLVRGHFKIRRTGVYWWHPFVRGDANKPTVERQRYEVKA